MAYVVGIVDIQKKYHEINQEECSLNESINIAFVLSLFAIIWAFFEVQTEGSISWAAIFPCLRHKASEDAKENTAYHVLMGLIFLVSFELFSVVVYGHWYFSKLLLIVPWIILAITLEDISWNFINPSKIYGWQKTFVERRYPAIGGIFIWNIPLDYFILCGVSLMSLILLGGSIMTWLQIFIFMFLVALSIKWVMSYIHELFPEWERYLRRYNMQHIWFYGKDVKATVIVEFSDGRPGYITEVSGVSPAGRIKSKSDEELWGI